MPIRTFDHCIFCYKKDTSNDPDVSRIKAKKEACRRFCTLSSRYLNITSFEFFSKQTLRSKQAFNNIESVCDLCLKTVSSFCDLYVQYEYLEIQMNFRIFEMCSVMKGTDQVGSRGARDREIIMEKMAKRQLTIGFLDKFRAQFLQGKSPIVNKHWHF